MPMSPWNASSRAHRNAIVITAALLIPGTVQAEGSGPIDPARLSQIVKALASDELMGRAPGGPGEQKTVEYLVGQFKAVGLEPAGENGGWTQKVPLVRFQMGQDVTLKLTAGSQTTSLRQAQEVMIN